MMNYFHKRNEFKETVEKIEQEMRGNAREDYFSTISIDPLEEIVKFELKSEFRFKTYIEIDIMTMDFRITGSDRPVYTSAAREAINMVEKFIWEVKEVKDKLLKEIENTCERTHQCIISYYEDVDGNTYIVTEVNGEVIRIDEEE